MLEGIDTWPVPHVAAAALDRSGRVVEARGETHRVFRLASISKLMTAWAILIACDEGVVALDDAAGQPGGTLRHLLAHAGGYPFEGVEPIAPVEQRRIYSNTGVELAAAHVEAAAGMPFATYLAEAVFEPLSMATTELRGSPAHGVYATVGDVATFLAETMHPRLLSAPLAVEAVTAQFPRLSGIVPAIGRFDPCPWGLGFELRGDKSPHWTGAHNSPATYGHFGGAGTMAWCDPAAGCALVALSDLAFDRWSVEAMRVWPALSDTTLATIGGSGDTASPS
ncbi:MAG: serine hydrolase domain-containing protein [Desertimonas sp.]